MKELPTAPPEHLAQDFARLRQEALRLVARYAPTQWTDHNDHDPGITILEQLCYAITDLGYRIGHPIPDLLAGSDLETALPGPAAILTSAPVTEGDLRRLALDVRDVANVWALPMTDPDLPLHYHEASREIRFDDDPGDADVRPLQLAGVRKVLVQGVPDRPAPTLAVAARLHAHRPLGEDLHLDTPTTHAVKIVAQIEIAAVEDPRVVLAAVVRAIDGCLAPRVAFTSLADALADGGRLDELFQGPAMDRGFVRGELSSFPRAVRASDLLHAITDVPDVRAVRSLTVGTTEDEHWSMTMPAGKVPVLDPASEFTLMRAGITVLLGRGQIPQQAPPTSRDNDTLALAPPVGRDRELLRYRSIQHDFPAAYGVSAFGVPAPATPQRRAQARQLSSYLLLFDQLLANGFAQLAAVRTLLAPAVQPRTYFAQPVEHPWLKPEELVQAPAGYGTWLRDNIEPDGTAASERRLHFLAHLLARFAEQVGDQAQGGDQLLATRDEFLRRYPELGHDRGSGHDIFGEPAAVSAFAERVRLKLGAGGPPFHVVEHVLLRPLAEDLRQLDTEGLPQIPFLAGVEEPDPWSLQLSFVFRGGAGSELEKRVAQALVAETPAHLRARLVWIDPGAPWTAFQDVWLAFKTAYRAYRSAALILGHQPNADEVQLRVRAARDRVIDQIEIGRTYPLRDLPVPEQVLVPPRKPATITIGLSQPDVLYRLHDRRTEKQLLVQDRPVEARGNGGTLELVTPPIDEGFFCRVQAVKPAGAGTQPTRATWLHRTVRVEVGLDLAVQARHRAPLFDPSIADPQPGDACVVDYGTAVEVEVLRSQEGVKYTLVDDAEPTVDLSPPVIGTSGTIVLRIPEVRDDFNVRVRGIKSVGSHSSRTLQDGLLTLVLPLSVRPNLAIPVTLVPPIVEYRTGTKLRLDATQPGVEYRVWRRRISDADFLFTSTSKPTIDIDDRGRAVRIERPPYPSIGQPASGFRADGPALTGNGGSLDIPIAASEEDSVLLVEAKKRHQPDLRGVHVSTLELGQGAMLLVRPDRRRSLELRVSVAGDTTAGPILVLGGLPGVFYQLYTLAPDKALGLPAYVHQRDDTDPTLNKGISQLRLGVDLVVARSPDGDPARVPPLPPLIEVSPVPLGTSIRVVARKAIDGLAVTLAATTVLAPVPAVRVEPSPVLVGAVARVVIEASVSGERYRLYRGDTLLAEAAGTGARIELATGALAASVVLELAVERPDGGSILISRRLGVSITVAQA